MVSNKNDSNNNSNNNNNNVNDIDHSLVVSVVNNVNDRSNNWIVDSGCSSHYCNNIKLLRNIRKEESTVACANGETVDIDKVGEVVMSSNINGKTVILKNVKYSPNFAHNLISVPKMIKNGASALFEDDQVIIKHKGIVLMRGIKRNGLLFLQCETIFQNDSALLMNENIDENELIHNRLGHIGNSGMKQLVINQAVSGIESIKLDQLKDCETCCIGKAHRNAFGVHLSREKAQVVLDDYIVI